MDAPPIQYALTSDGVSIAYSVLGEGPALLLSIPSMGAHLQKDWAFPVLQRYYALLARSLTLVRFDHRGGGLSAHAAGRYATEDFAKDIAALAERLGLERFALWGSGRSTAAVAAYAASHPQRVSHLILWVPLISGKDHAMSAKTQALHSAEELDPEVANVARASLLAGKEAESVPELIEFISHVRMAADPQVIKALADFDARPWLAEINVPTLIMTRQETRYNNENVSRTIAAVIKNAQLAVLNGQSALPYLGNYREVAERAAAFITGSRFTQKPPQPGSAIRIILFTDVEDSTALTDGFGDSKARIILRGHEAIVREALATHSGIEIKTMGDGFMLSFVSASSALDAAIAMQRAISQAFSNSETPIRMRIGIHAGEPIEEKNDLHGTAVIRAARIMQHAEGGQILASDLVRQLVAGKDYVFSDQGTVTLKGFDEPQRLFVLRWQVPN